MGVHTISRTTVVAVLVATTAALVGRSWLQVHLRQTGMNVTTAADLSYLVVPPILILLLLPLWKSEKKFLADQFRRRNLTWRVALTAFAIGLLLRLLWWSKVVAGVSFGFYSSTASNAIVGPVFSFQCSAPEIILLGFFVMAFIVPLIEEITHRALIQTALDRRSFAFAIIVSSIVFTVFHRFDSWPTVFLGGLVLGAQYRITRSLWSSVITHVTVNGLIQVDWRCLSSQWNPMPDSLPLLLPGATAVFVFLICILTLFLLLHRMATETKNPPR